MERINKLIRELLSTPPKKESCNCGCHSCENVGNKGPVLNESLKAKVIMTENMQHHVKNKLPITENTFRYGSKSFLDLWAEARYLYSRNAIHVNEDDKHIILETNLGEYGIYNGKKVPLDMIMEEEERGGEEDLQYAKDIKFQPLSDLLGIIINKYHDTDNKTYLDLYNELQELFTQDLKVKLNYTEILIVLKKYLTDSEINKLLVAVNAGLNESKDKKTPPLNKPRRGGSKKFYVYVRDPRTKKIKKVSFGMAGGGLHAKLNNPKARKAFASRHDCKNKKDRTKASYWSCHLPRYASLLGIKSNFSGYW
jgi:hypothetical protein